MTDLSLNAPRAAGPPPPGFDWRAALQRALLTDAPVACASVRLEPSDFAAAGETMLYIYAAFYNEALRHYFAACGQADAIIRSELAAREPLDAALEKLDRLDVVWFEAVCPLSGAALDVEPLVWQVRKRFPQARILLNATRYLGAAPLYLDDWGLDGLLWRATPGCTLTALYPRAGVQTAFPECEPPEHAAAYLAEIDRAGVPARLNASIERMRAFQRFVLEEMEGEIAAERPGPSLTPFRLPGRLYHLAHEAQDWLIDRYALKLSVGEDADGKPLLLVNHLAADYPAAAPRLMGALRALCAEGLKAAAS